jgi:hypothetical protein
MRAWMRGWSSLEVMPSRIGIGMENGPEVENGQISRVEVKGDSNRLRTICAQPKLEPDLPWSLLARRRGEGIGWLRYEKNV